MQEIKINDKTIKYSVEYRKVKYIRYEFKRGKLKVIVPKRYDENIEECIHKKDKWIYKQIINYENRTKQLEENTKNKTLSTRTLEELKTIIKRYIKQYENQLKVKTNRVQYRKMNRKWGSCSSLNNVTLSVDLKYLPEELVAYIVYHELSHLLILDHNDEFYKIIKKEYPNYIEYDKMLSDYWYLITK